MDKPTYSVYESVTGGQFYNFVLINLGSLVFIKEQASNMLFGA